MALFSLIPYLLGEPGCGSQDAEKVAFLTESWAWPTQRKDTESHGTQGTHSLNQKGSHGLNRQGYVRESKRVGGMGQVMLDRLARGHGM